GRGAAVELRSGGNPRPERPAGGLCLPLGAALGHRLAGGAGAGLPLRGAPGRRHPGLEGGWPADRELTRWISRRSIGNPLHICTRRCMIAPLASIREGSPMRRLPIVTLLAALALTLIADPAGAEARRRTVNVYNWTDYIDPSVLEDFTKTTGITVRYDTFDSNDVLEAKLLAGRSGYDVVAPTAYFLERQIKAGVFARLDKSKLPNLANMWPEITRRLAQYDPDNLYGVNYMWGTTGIGYNLKKS